VSASEVPCTYLRNIIARALTVEEIEDIIEKYGIAAQRAKRAGVDAVEVHAAHGSTLIANFLSPLTNKRTDSYGGTLENRARLAIEVLQRIKNKVGRAYPVIFRVSGDEFVPGGLTLDDTKKIAKMLEENGVDALHITAGNIAYEESYYRTYPPMAMPRACNVYLAEAIKKVVSVPVIAVGRINDPVLAENILRNGQADLIAMGRALIADPELPNKAYEGRLEDIRKCIGCFQDCGQPASNRTRLRCAVNAECGKEIEYKLTRADVRKKVLIIGGGPAGMEAARVAALRGHNVYLYEAGEKLGGQLLIASKVPGKEEINNLIEYLTTQIGKLGVNVRLGKEATAEIIYDIQPDVVVVATGATPLIPPIRGVNLPHVLTAWQVLGWRNSQAKTGDNVVVAGGGSVGCETAEYLAEQGKRVTIIEMLDEIAEDMPYSSKIILKKKLSECQVNVILGHELKEITENSVVTVNKKGECEIIECDTVVLALGSLPNSSVISAFKHIFPKTYAIGDCLKPRRLLEAIHDGYRVAFSL
ncbi:MAG: FAD-dependent oxidoreductase, partial [Nitrososphaeria archaeon]